MLTPPKLRPYRLSNKRVVGQHRIFRVEQQDVHSADGAPLRDVFTFACADWCNVVAVTPERELVLVWQYRFGTEVLELETPGGTVDEGEDPATTAARELREETGYEAERIESLGVVSPNPAIQGNRCHLFLATGCRKTAETDFDELEELEVALVPEAYTARLIDEGTVRHAIAVVALERFLRRR